MNRFLILTLSVTINLAFGQTITLKGGVIHSKIYAKYKPENPTPSDNWSTYQFPKYFEGGYLGWNASVGVNYLKKKRIFLSSDAGIVQTGSTGTENYQPYGGGMTERELKSDFTFITLNTLINLHLLSREKISINVGIGPQFGFLADHHFPEMYNDVLFQIYHLEENLSKVVIDLKGQFELNFHQGHFQYGISCGYDYNALPLLHYTGNTNFPSLGTVKFTMINNYAFANLSIGYTLPKKKEKPDSGNQQ